MKYNDLNLHINCYYCGYYNTIKEEHLNSGYVRCAYCEKLNTITNDCRVEVEKTPKYKLLELGEDVIKYGYKGV